MNLAGDNSCGRLGSEENVETSLTGDNSCRRSGSEERLARLAGDNSCEREGSAERGDKSLTALIGESSCGRPGSETGVKAILGESNGVCAAATVAAAVGAPAVPGARAKDACAGTGVGVNTVTGEG